MGHNYSFRKFLFIFSYILFSTSIFAQVKEQWVRRYNGPARSDDGATSLTIDAPGNVYVTGISRGTGTLFDIATIKYGPSGDEQWIKRYNSAENGSDFASDIVVDDDGNVYVSGNTSKDNLASDYVIIKYDDSGNELWVRKYNGTGNSTDYTADLALDTEGNVYVTGSSTGNGTDLDYTTIKYDGNGNELWVSRYNGPGNNTDIVRSITLDKFGNVYITGQSIGLGTSEDYATIKYDHNGNELWVKRYNGPGNGMDQVRSLAIDSKGNVYVAGNTLSSDFDDDYATIKYDQNGNEHWIRWYDGPGDDRDEAYGVAIDVQGNVYITGVSSGLETGLDYATIKYDPLGNSLWVKRYNGPSGTNSYDFASRIAVDDSNNIYVTGHSDGDGTDLDYTTIKYNPDGTTLWVKRYNGPANNYDQPTCMIIDNLANIYLTGESGGDFATLKYTQSTVTNNKCGRNGEKVLVCHKGKTLCILQSAVAAHLKHGDVLGSCTASDLNSITERDDLSLLKEELPKQFRVSFAPNPFNTNTQVRYDLPVDGTVSIKVYNMVGKEVATVVQEERKAGLYSLELSSSTLVKGVYYYRALFTTEQKKVITQTGKLTVVK